MALFGAPAAHEDDALRACDAALSIRASVSVFAESLKDELAVDFQMRFGLNTGPVIVGAIGDNLNYLLSYFL